MFEQRGPLSCAVSGTFVRGTLECLLLRDECLPRERVGNRLKTISTNILRALRGPVLRKFTPAMHRIPLFVPLNSRHSCCSSKQRLVRAETANFYRENKLLPFVQVSQGENGAVVAPKLPRVSAQRGFPSCGYQYRRKIIYW